MKGSNYRNRWPKEIRRQLLETLKGLEAVNVPLDGLEGCNRVLARLAGHLATRLNAGGRKTFLLPPFFPCHGSALRKEPTELCLCRYAITLEQVAVHHPVEVGHRCQEG